MESHTISLLLVEDHASTARAVGSYLESIGYKVEVASNAKSARKLALAGAFDAIVCDIQLPDGNGWDLMRYINRKRPLPGIAISGFSSEYDIERSDRAGFFKHLAKPFSPEDLTDALEALPVASR